MTKQSLRWKSGFDFGLLTKQIQFAEEYLSEFMIIWLGETRRRNQTDEKIVQLLIGLQEKVQTVHKIYTLTECYRSLRTFRDSNVFLIVTKDQYLTRQDLIQLKSSLNVKYMFCFGVEPPWKKYLGNFDKNLHRYSLIESQINILPYNLKKRRKIEDYDAETQLLLVQQLLLELLVRQTPNKKTFNEFLAYVRRFYSNNPARLQQIDDYEKNPKRLSPIERYTEVYSINSVLQDSLRSHNLERIYQIRHFVIELYQQIKQIHSKQLEERMSKRTLKLYRGKNLPIEEFISLKKSKGEHLITNSFVSATSDKKVAYLYLDATATQRNTQIVPVIYCFEFDCVQNITKPMANVKHLSQVQHECEFIFTMGMIFVLNDIKEKNGIYEIYVRRTAEIQHYSEKLFKHFFENQTLINRILAILSDFTNRPSQNNINSLDLPEIHSCIVNVPTDDGVYPFSHVVNPKSRKGFTSILRPFGNIKRKFQWATITFVVLLIILIVVAIILGVVFSQSSTVANVQYVSTKTKINFNGTATTISTSIVSKSNSMFTRGESLLLPCCLLEAVWILVTPSLLDIHDFYQENHQADVVYLIILLGKFYSQSKK